MRGAIRLCVGILALTALQGCKGRYDVMGTEPGNPYTAPSETVSTRLSDEAQRRHDLARTADFPSLSSVPARPDNLPTAADIAAQYEDLAADRAAAEAERAASMPVPPALPAADDSVSEVEPQPQSMEDVPAQADEAGPRARYRIGFAPGVTTLSADVRTGLSAVALESVTFGKVIRIAGAPELVAVVKSGLMDEGVTEALIRTEGATAQQPARRVDIFFVD